MPLDSCDRPCPVCDHGETQAVLERANVPVHQNSLFQHSVEARAVRRGQLSIRCCVRCGFTFNATFDANLLDYGPNYENTQTCSSMFDEHVNRLIEHLESTGVRWGRIVEVGCGKGGFLARLLSRPGNHATGIGFDPSYLGPDCQLEGRLEFRKTFFGPETPTAADAAISRHVIEHVEHPVDFLRSIRAGLQDAASPRLFLETPCVDWILRNQVVWDFFYEHCSLFTPHSLGLAMHRAGFATREIRHVFGGQYLWAEGGLPVGPRPEVNIGPLLESAAAFRRSDRQLRQRWHEIVEDACREGPVFVWGAGAKGVTFCNLLDPECRQIAGVVDVNPLKQGMHLAGTGHPIVSPSTAVQLGVAVVLILNPNYTSEIVVALRALGSPAATLDLMGKETRHAVSH